MNIILQAITGSVAYGLNTPDSDVDRRGIYLADTRDVLGLDGPSIVDKSLDTTTDEGDLALYELGKFTNLALNANPTILEILYANGHEIATKAGRLLVGARGLFLSTDRVRGAYCGYALDQARKLYRRSEQGQSGFGRVPDNRTRKHGRHALRLIIQAEQLLTEGMLTLDVGERRQEIFDAGQQAAADPAGFLRMIEGHVRRIDRLHSVLPDRPHRDTISRIVTYIRLTQLERR